MALCRIPYSVNTLHNGIHGSVIAYCIVSAVKVIVNRSRQSNATNVVFLGKETGSCQRTITTYDNECVYLLLL